MPKQTQKTKTQRRAAQVDPGFAARLSQVVAVEEIYDLIRERLQQLTAQSDVTTISALENAQHEGFIHPEASVLSNYLFAPLRVNDEAPYRLLIELLEQIAMMPSWADRTTDELHDYAIAATVSHYFGHDLITPEVDAAHEAFYVECATAAMPNVPLDELRAKHCSGPLERTALVQNLNAFLGRETWMMVSAHCKLGTYTTDVHAYNLYRNLSGNWAILDCSRPRFVYGGYGEVFSTLPAIYTISEHQAAALFEGGEVEVLHRDVNIDDETCQLTKRRYTGAVLS